MIDQAVAKSGVAGSVTFAATAASAMPIDIAVLLGAFAGSTVFVLSAAEYHWLRRVAYLFASTTIGYLSSAWVATTLGIASRADGAIICGLLSIVALNGLVTAAKNGNLLSTIISRLTRGRK